MGIGYWQNVYAHSSDPGHEGGSGDGGGGSGGDGYLETEKKKKR